MTNEEINKALATWAGVHICKDFDGGVCVRCGQATWPSKADIAPDYCSSLDLLAPLEAKALAELGSTAFVECLLDGLGLVRPASNLALALIATAPPAIRAKAIYNLVMEGR